MIKEWNKNGLEHALFVGCDGLRAIMEPFKFLLDKFSPTC
jgi:hypothetical protein